MSDRISMLEAQIALKFDMEDFKQSDVGKYFAHRAAEDILSGANELKAVDPFDSKEIMRIQQNIHVAERFFSWMDEAIHHGRNALEESERLANIDQG